MDHQSTPLDLSFKTKKLKKEEKNKDLQLTESNATSNPELKISEESLSSGESPAGSLLSDRHPCNFSLMPQSSSNFHDDSCRRHRTAFSRTQTSRLENEFKNDNYLSRSKRMDLAKELNLHENTIKVKAYNQIKI